MNISTQYKIIGFDSWTGGAHFFERYVEVFAKMGLDLSLIHLGSWGGDANRPDNEKIGNLFLRDVKHFSQKSFLEIIEIEKPSAVIFLSNHTFAHRAFNRLCHYRNIPTIHVFHGLVTVQDFGSNSAYKINPIAQVRFIIERVFKLFRFVMPEYIRALYQTNASLSEWIRFAIDIVYLSLGATPKAFAKDSKTDCCCVFTAADTDYAVTKYGYAQKDVVPVGNPDLITFGLTETLIGSRVLNAQNESNEVIYIDTGLVYTGYVFESQTEFTQHIIETRNVLQYQGKHLVFKPHPQHLRHKSVISALTDAKIDICSNTDFIQRLQVCCACIVEPSTVSLIPALVGLPLFLASYGKLKNQKYGDAVTSYPRSVVLSNLKDFSSLLATDSANIDEASIRKWIEINAGPLPAEDISFRVANVLLKLISDRTQISLDTSSLRSRGSI